MVCRSILAKGRYWYYYFPADATGLDYQYLFERDSMQTAAASLAEIGITEARVAKARKLNEIAIKRKQSLAQMAIAWVLRKGKVSLGVGWSRKSFSYRRQHCSAEQS